MKCRLKALSPTALHTWESNPVEFVNNYVIDKPKMPQTPAMSIGSAFDCRAKAFLQGKLCGKETEEFILKNLFDSAVSSHNADWAWAESEKLFKKYLDSGAMNDMLLELTDFTVMPKFEFSVGSSLTEAQVCSVPLYGKPDCYFVNAHKVHVILDWKVNGYMSKASPAAGYVKIRPLNRAYKDMTVMPFKGMRIGFGVPLKRDWEDQLIMYAWMLAGSLDLSSEDWVVGIDQLACNGPDDVRVASFRSTINPTAAKALWERVVRCWDHIQREHYFANMSEADSNDYTERLVAMNGTSVVSMLDVPLLFDL